MIFTRSCQVIIFHKIYVGGFNRLMRSSPSNSLDSHASKNLNTIRTGFRKPKLSILAIPYDKHGCILSPALLETDFPQTINFCVNRSTTKSFLIDSVSNDFITTEKKTNHRDSAIGFQRLLLCLLKQNKKVHGVQITKRTMFAIQESLNAIFQRDRLTLVFISLIQTVVKFRSCCSHSACLM